MRQTAVVLTKRLKVNLLRAMQKGEINLTDFPELQNAYSEVISVQVEQFSEEERAVLLKLSRSRPLESYASGDNISVSLTGEMKHRLLKAMQTGRIDMTDFTDLQATDREPVNINLDLFSPEEQQILSNFLTHR